MKKLIVLITFMIVLTALGMALLFDAHRLEYRWQPGTEYNYDFAYSAKARTKLAAGDGGSKLEESPLSADVKLNGSLTIACYANDAGRALLGISLDDLDDARYSFGGANLFGKNGLTREELEGHEILVEMERDGKIVGFDYREGSSLLFRQLASSIVGELQYIVRDEGRQWTVEEKNLTGDFEASYTRGFWPFDNRQLTKEVKTYSRITGWSKIPGEPMIEGSYRVDFHEHGVWDQIKGNHRLVLGPENTPELDVSSSVFLSLREMTSFTVDQERPILSRGGTDSLSYQLGDMVSGGIADERSLSKQAGDMMSFADLEKWIRNWEPSDAEKNNRSMWQAAAYLRLHPEDAPKMIALFEEPDLDTGRRRIVLHALASAGNSESQQAMRDILAGDVAGSDPGYSLMIQALSFVQRPESETMAFLAEKSESLQGASKIGAIYSLGSAAGKLRQLGDQQAALSSNQLIVEKLKQSRDPEEQEHLLSALGNAGMEENIEMIGDFVDSDDANVRESAALALRKTQTEESENLLFELASDDAPSVRSASLRSLADYKLRAEHYERLNGLVEGDRLTESSFYDYLPLLGRSEAGEHAIEAVDLMLAKNLRDKDLAGRLVSMRRQLREFQDARESMEKAN